MKIEPFKMKVTPEQSKRVQEILFKNGYSWFMNGATNVKHLYSPYLYFTQSIRLRETQPNLTKGDFKFTFYENDAPELTYQEFMDKYDFELPKQWCVRLTNDNSEFINKVRDRNCSSGGFITSRLIDPEINNSWYYYTSPPEEYKEITFEQFKKYVLKEKTMDKKIIGYKLIKPEYEKIALKALGLQSAREPFIIAGMLGYYVPKIKELGIMDWFEPVYEAEFKDGDWVTYIGGCIPPYTTQIQSIGNDGWIRSNINKPNEGHYHYSQYRKATPEEIEAVQEIKMPFGDIKVVVDPYFVVYTPEAVKIPFKDIRDLLAHWDYEMSAGAPHCYRIFIADEAIIQVGCMKGTFKQLLDIYSKMRELRYET